MKWLKRSNTLWKTVRRYGLAELFVPLAKKGWQRRLLAALPQSRDSSAEPLPVRLRLALESLGPVFVKFGQVLSTRPDLIPHDYAVELAKLQDKVPPFDADLSRRQIEKAFGKPIAELYAEFETQPVASASVAQVHKARLHGGERVAVSVAAGHPAGYRAGFGTAAFRCGLGGAAVCRRQTPAAARSGGRIRQVFARRVGFDARSGQLQPARP